jgi:hypothetical protein
MYQSYTLTFNVTAGLGICVPIDHIFINYSAATHVNHSRECQVVEKNVNIDRICAVQPVMTV